MKNIISYLVCRLRTFTISVTAHNKVLVNVTMIYFNIGLSIDSVIYIVFIVSYEVHEYIYSDGRNVSLEIKETELFKCFYGYLIFLNVWYEFTLT